VAAVRVNCSPRKNWGILENAEKRGKGVVACKAQKGDEREKGKGLKRNSKKSARITELRGCCTKIKRGRGEMKKFRESFPGRDTKRGGEGPHYLLGKRAREKNRERT